MRDDYLFRGKRIDGAALAEGLLCQEYDPFKNEFYMAIAEIQEDNPDREPGWFASGRKITVRPDTVGRCTGLRDKSGTLIFEGDVVKLCDTNPILLVASVEMRKFGWRCVFRYADDNKIVDNCFLDKCEIIGNIHDNPELMGGIKCLEKS